MDALCTRPSGPNVTFTTPVPVGPPSRLQLASVPFMTDSAAVACPRSKAFGLRAVGATVTVVVGAAVVVGGAALGGGSGSMATVALVDGCGVGSGGVGRGAVLAAMGADALAGAPALALVESPLSFAL